MPITEPVTLDAIQMKATALAEVHRDLAKAAVALDSKLATIRKLHTPSLRRLADAAREMEAELLGLVTDNPALFERPKSREFEGVKVGWKKGKGKITFGDEDVLITRIRKLLPDQEDALIVTKESVDKSALGEAKLDAAMLKRLGVEVTGAGDQPFVKHVDTTIDKLVTVLLGAEADES